MERPLSKCVVVLLVAVMTLCTQTLQAQNREKQYIAKQIKQLNIDGNLNEWKYAEIVQFDELKDVGDKLPDPDDFSGQGRVAWNEDDPHRIYFAVEITDDELQDIHPAGDKWWEDDSVEFMFDFDNGMVRASLSQWTIAANGKEISADGTPDNTEWVVLNDGNQYIYEVAIDPTQVNKGASADFKAEDGLVIGLSFHMNDCENGVREHQIGWMPGGAWDALAYGDLIFSREVLAVEPSGKLAATWADIRR